MKTRCKKCQKRIQMTRLQHRRLIGRGPDAYYRVTYTCPMCEATDEGKCYPNLLADVFRVPKR
jgi:hypothetical protein